jgi:hypothetical protein
MTIAEREQQILRVKEQSFQPAIEEALEQKLREGVLEVVKMTLEASLCPFAHFKPARFN